VIATVAPLGQGIDRGLPLDVGAGDVVEEEVVVQAEERAEAADEVLFEGGLVREELIQGAVAAVVVDEGRGHAEQILQGGLAIPRLGEVEFAGRLTEAGQHQDRHHGWPGDRLPARGQQPLQQGLQLQRAPEQPAEPHIAEGAPPLQAHAVQPDGHGRGRGIRRLEEVALRLTAGESRGQRPGAGPPLASSSPSWATVCWTTFLPTRTERTRRQYV